MWSTRIFARPLEGGRQLLVYGMTFDASSDLAMILPIPVPPGSAEDAVKFVDLSLCPSFFDDLETLFPVLASFGGYGAPMARAAAMEVPKLVVHDVGEFEASFVPTPRDFDRLDARFRLPGEVWDQLPQYGDWGFCVFKLRAPASRERGGLLGFLGLESKAKSTDPGGRKVHPMAFEFPRRDTSALFYPTVHVHDGLVHPTAHFDHQLFCQVEPALEPLMDWTRSSSTAESLIPAARIHVDRNAWMYKRGLNGELPNRDTFLDESKLRARTVVQGPLRLRMYAAWEHVIDDGKVQLDARVKNWLRVSEAERASIRDAVLARLSTFIARHHDEWKLGPFAHELRRDFPDIPGLPTQQADAGACWCAFSASNERIEPQWLDVAFTRRPTPEIRSMLQHAFQDALDHATH